MFMYKGFYDTCTAGNMIEMDKWQYDTKKIIIVVWRKMQP